MKKQLLTLSAVVLAATGINAQQLRGPESETDTRKCYVTWPSSEALDLYINDWEPGQEMTKTYSGRVAAGEWEDEEFFISRVKLRPLISNVATQIFEEYVGDRDKRLLFWVPCGMSTGFFQTGSLPNGVFDSEVFSTWSYVTHYGNWTSPYGWVPGGFADAAHKHGVLASGLASIPWAVNSGTWHTCLAGMGQLSTDIDKVGKFLLYHGVDGLGYNSEFGGGGNFIADLRTLHGGLVKWMKEKGQANFENPWYNLTGDSGALDAGRGVFTANSFQNFGYADEPRTIIFTDYGWCGSSSLQSDATSIARTGRPSTDLYMGTNMEGGCKSQYEWQEHTTGGARNFSVGLWGSHAKNLLYPARVNYGGSDMAKQQGYQRVLEQFFGNGMRNPAAKMDVKLTTSCSASDDFQGMSRMMNARSAYGWDLGEEPFITYFSLGNGPRYMREGEVAYPNEWYNIGVQDYTPTWRFWWADKLLGKEPTDIPENSMNAEYSWADAWNGGSSLRISGSTAEGQTQYLHLFKTAFNVKNGDVVKIRYKILAGDGDINFLYSLVGSEAKEASADARTSVHAKGSDFFYDEWNEATLRVANRGGMSQGEWALMGLKFRNAENLDVLIGEMSVVRGKSPIPATPSIRKAKVLGNVVEGLDAKVFFQMPNDKAAGEPVYNTDVNVSHFNLWAQIQGETAQFMGATTSWAGLMFKIQDPNHVGKVRVGVEAVSLDHKSSSGVVWSNYMDAPAHEVSENVAIDKTCIKPDEQFRIWFIDDLHSDATLSLYNTAGAKVASNNGNGRELVASLPEVGAYDLVANEGTAKERRYSCYVQVSGFSVGRVPEIESLTINGEEASAETVEFGMGTEFKAGYTGREADGSGSQALKCDYKMFGGPIKEMQLGANKSFSVSYWICLTDIPATGDLNFFGIEDRTGSWPENNWGFFWSHISSNGHVNSYTKRGSSASPEEYKHLYPETTVITPGAWTHVTHVFDYDAKNALLMKLYINGVYQVPSVSGLGKDNELSADNVRDGIPVRGPNRSVMRDGMWMHILGGRGSTPGNANGMIDDVTVWDGSIDETDIKKAMNGLDANNLPANVKCFWSFEDEPVDGVTESKLNDVYTHNGRFMSKGTITDAPFGVFDLLKGENEGQSAQCHIAPSVEAGCPYVPGSGFKVVTKPSWSTRQATISNADGSDTQGEATIAYGKDGDKTLTLTLENSWGKDVKVYPVFSVNAIEGVNADEADAMKAYTVNKTLFLEFAEAGDYEVKVFNMSGMLTGSDARAINAGELMNITLGQAGVYVVSVVKDGKELRSIKVVNK